MLDFNRPKRIAALSDFPAAPCPREAKSLCYENRHQAALQGTWALVTSQTLRGSTALPCLVPAQLTLRDPRGSLFSFVLLCLLV